MGPLVGQLAMTPRPQATESLSPPPPARGRQYEFFTMGKQEREGREKSRDTVLGGKKTTTYEKGDMEFFNKKYKPLYCVEEQENFSLKQCDLYWQEY